MAETPAGVLEVELHQLGAAVEVPAAHLVDEQLGAAAAIAATGGARRRLQRGAAAAGQRAGAAATAAATAVANLQNQDQPPSGINLDRNCRSGQ